MNLLSKAIGAGIGRNLGESFDSAVQQYQPPSLLDGLKQQRDVLAAKLIKIDDAIAAVEANPAIVDVLQKLSSL